MVKFIEVQTLDCETPALINPDYIVSIYQDDNGCTCIETVKFTFRTDETTVDIMGKIKETNRVKV